MRLLALGLAIALIIFVISGGHIFFLPLLFLPLGLFSFGHRRRRGTLLARRRSGWFLRLPRTTEHPKHESRAVGSGHAR
jgi:hypothetical protein